MSLPIETKTVLVTGASGFVGRAVVAGLLADGWHVRAITRSFPAAGESSPIEWLVAEMVDCKDWAPYVAGCQAVIHLAARVHVMHEKRDEVTIWEEYRAANVEVTDRLAQAAAEAGVQRFIFMSSVKVNGESRDKPYDELDVPAPADAYGRSKHQAELALISRAEGTQMQAVALRPPLVYGPGVRANFLSLMRMVISGAPLPFALIRNKRSLIFVGNLADAVMTALKAHELPSAVYLVSDGEDMSTPDLIRAVARAAGKSARLLPVPVSCLRVILALLGRANMVDRLAGNLCVDSGRLCRELNWRPPYSSRQALEVTVSSYLASVAAK